MRRRQIETKKAGRKTISVEPLNEGAIPLRKSGRRDWHSMSDSQLIQHARGFMKKNKITRRRQFQNADQGLFGTLRKRKLIAKVSFEQNLKEFRVWNSMTDSQLIQHALGFIKENGITVKIRLCKANRNLFEALLRRKLLAKVGFGRRYRERRDWAPMADDQLIQYAKDCMAEKGINGKTQLQDADCGLYDAIRKRRLLSVVFASIEQGRGRCPESELVSGLRQAADAMKEFGEGK
jgi:hypothetical protein